MIVKKCKKCNAEITFTEEDYAISGFICNYCGD